MAIYADVIYATRTSGRPVVRLHDRPARSVLLLVLLFALLPVATRGYSFDYFEPKVQRWSTCSASVVIFAWRFGSRLPVVTPWSRLL